MSKNGLDLLSQKVTDKLLVMDKIEAPEKFTDEEIKKLYSMIKELLDKPDEVKRRINITIWAYKDKIPGIGKAIGKAKSDIGITDYFLHWSGQSSND